MIQLLKNKWTDIYSYIDHYIWKNEEDIFWVIVFLLACLIVSK